MMILWILLGILAILAAAVLVRTYTTPSKAAAYKAPATDARAEEYAQKLSRMVAFETVSVPETNQREKFLPFHQLLK